MFENTPEEKVQENVIGGGKFNEKFVFVRDNFGLLVKPRHMSKDQTNRHFHMFHMIAAKNRILIPEDLINIRISYIKNIVGEINLQDFIPCEQDECKLREEIVVFGDFPKLIDELKRSIPSSVLSMSIVS